MMLWLYQLQNADVEDISQTEFTHVIIDYSPDGNDANRYTKEEIGILLDSSITPLAYLSIGEAEDYRFYWQGDWVNTPGNNDFTEHAPAWLGHTNPHWPGNYKARYWDAEWRDSCLRPYLDRIIAQEFRGVFLDIIDGFEYWHSRESYEGENGETLLDDDPYQDPAEAAARMINLVVWVAEYCRANSVWGEEFIILPQNAERLLDFDHDNAYLDNISGLGAESLWYLGTEPQDQELITYRLKYLRQIADAGKMIVVVDYVDDGSRMKFSNRKRIRDFILKCAAEGFNPYAARTDRLLDTLNIIPGFQPCAL